MKFSKILTLTLALCGASGAAAVSPAIPRDARLEQRVDSVLAKMTLDEKIGQMTELAIDVLGTGTGNDFVLDEAKLRDIVSKYKIGSFLSAPGPIALSPQKWNQIIARINRVSIEVMGIPTIYGLDQNHGTTYTLGGTLFPQNITIDASYNPTLSPDAADITA